MKIAAIILGVLGILTSVGLGGKWLYDYQSVKEEYKKAKEVVEMGLLDSESEAKVEKAANIVKAAYALITVGVLAIFILILMGKFGGRVSGASMMFGSLVPGIFMPMSLVATALIFLGGVFALFAKKKQL